MKGLPVKPRAVSEPAPVVDLMVALKRSLAQEQPGVAPRGQARKQPDTKAAPDRCQAALLLPLSGRRKTKREPITEPTTTAAQR